MYVLILLRRKKHCREKDITKNPQGGKSGKRRGSQDIIYSGTPKHITEKQHRGGRGTGA